ncbi:hypothetical protein AVEN_248041-1 [Araneus ventricosus]|uniref:Uncharacterized protein n=1 Tax=Araneus ventricosus TaxID=182803 RepID=A0A4Y2HKU8_ARAVE|nr:hypothetical protein AVEN_248041-1 [Araneus ventricosus]
MLLSFSLVLGFVMNNPAAENALSASADVGGIIFKASPSFIIFDEQFSVESNNCNSCLTILLKLELFLVEQRRTFVYELQRIQRLDQRTFHILSKFNLFSTLSLNSDSIVYSTLQ